jgi:hypothetical protein
MTKITTVLEQYTIKIYGGVEIKINTLTSTFDGRE